MLKNGKLTLLFIIFALICIVGAGCASAVDSGSDVDPASGYGTDTGSGTDNTTTTQTNSTGLADSEWPSYHNDENNTGQSNYTGPQTNTTKWTYGNITVYGSAVIGTNGNIYIAGNDGVLYVFSSNGILQWTWTTRSPILGSPTIGSDGTIYISNWMNSTTYAIASNGTLLWKCTTGDYNFGSSPVIDLDGTIYITVTNDTYGALYAINPDGTLKWKYSTGMIYATSPIIGSDGTIYLADYDGVVYALNSNGTLKWSYTLIYKDSGVNYHVNIYYNTLSIGSDGTIYIASHNGRFISKSKNEVRSTIGVLFALNADGSLKWLYNVGEMLYGTPAISSDGTIYVVSVSKLYAFVDNGTNVIVKWSCNTGVSTTGLTSAAIGSDGIIYVGSSTGVYALNPDGTLKWKYSTDSVVGSPAIGRDGTLYIGTVNGTFYAFNDLAANFTVEPVKGTALTDQFTGSCTSKALSWKWDFGDGYTSTDQNPQHIYSKAGTYTITLAVTLQNGTVIIRTQLVTITEMDITAPTASSNLSTGTYNNTQAVKLDATDDSNNTTIYYTTDGTDPRTSSTRYTYTDHLTISTSTTIKFAAVDAAGNWSPVYTENYTIIDVIYIQDASAYNKTTINSDIQALIDSATPGSTVVFMGQSYDNLKLVINKKLNIISNSSTGTKIVTNSSGSAVFFINGTNASGTQISGFIIITNTSSGILVDGTNSTTISDVVVTSNGGTAITVSGSSNTNIKYSILTGSSVGINIINSNNTNVTGSIITNNLKKGIGIDSSVLTTISNCYIITNGDNASTVVDEGGIYVKDSEQVLISYNTINGNFFGISTNNVSNLTIFYNMINSNFVDGIYLYGTTRNLNITNNTIQYNANGIGIDFSKSENISVTGNDISFSVNRGDQIKIPSIYGTFTAGNGVTFGINYESTSDGSERNIKHNVITNNDDRDIDAHDELHHGTGELPVGSNITTYPTNSIDTKYCCKINSNPAQLMGGMLSDGSIIFYFWDPDAKEMITDIPSIAMEITVNGVKYTVWTVNGVAILKLPLTEVNGQGTGHYVNNENSVSLFNIPLSTNGEKGYKSYTQSDTPIGGGNSPSNIGTPTAGSGGGSGGNSGSGASSGSSALGAAAAASAAGSSSPGVLGALGSQLKKVQELITDEVKKNPQFWGIIAIILLIIVVILAYYRKDIMVMIEKSRK